MLIDLNKQHYDPSFVKLGENSYMTTDSTNRHRPLGDPFVMGTPPFMAKDDTPIPHGDTTIYCRYSDIPYGNITYYVDTELANPFVTTHGRGLANYATSRVDPDNTVEYRRYVFGVRQPYRGIEWMLDTQRQREDLTALQMRTMVRNDAIPYALF